MPAAEVDVDEALVSRLLAAQAPPELVAGRALQPLANGWDNVVFRLGDDLVVRLPRRAAGAPLIEHEQRWLASLAPSLPLPVPAPVFCGRPADDGGYPWRWSVCPWLPGDVAGRTPPADPIEAAEVLGGFVRALHALAVPDDAPRNPVRGGPLAGRDEVTRQRVAQLGGLIDGTRVLAAWDELRETAAWPRPPVWLHGDLHPANVLVDDGRITGVIDFGDLCAGDPATDLAVAWSLFPGSGTARRRFREAAGYDGDDATWARGRGWALVLSLAYVAGSADNPLIAGIGRAMLEAALTPPA